MRVVSFSSVWIILGVFLVFLYIVCLRLGLKASSLTETDIIMYYSDVYLENERVEGGDVQLTDCYALAGTEIWERMEVICTPENVAPYRYVIGFWTASLKRSLISEAEFESTIFV
jgi:hypothetical protein